MKLVVTETTLTLRTETKLTIRNDKAVHGGLVWYGFFICMIIVKITAGVHGGVGLNSLVHFHSM